MGNRMRTGPGAPRGVHGWALCSALSLSVAFGLPSCATSTPAAPTAGSAAEPAEAVVATGATGEAVVATGATGEAVVATGATEEAVVATRATEADESPVTRGTQTTREDTPAMADNDSSASAATNAQGTAGGWPPVPTDADVRRPERLAMVDRQITSSVGGRLPISDPDVVRAMRDVPRHAFVPRALWSRAYDDSPLPIGDGQTISQPYVVAFMTEALRLRATDRVLEIGTGSGYQAAVLAHITPHVWSIEIVAPLARRAERALREQGYDGIRLRVGDGYAGWPEEAPFDAIMLTAAAPEIPQPLWDQLAPGGRLLMPEGPRDRVQQLVIYHREADGGRRVERLMPVRFVPFTRADEHEATPSGPDED